MSVYAVPPEDTHAAVLAALGDKITSSVIALGEVIITVDASHYRAVAVILRDAETCKFEQLMDLCAVDYSTYGERTATGSRFCVVLHLLSISLNQRVRVKIFANDDNAPMVPSVTDVWNSADWFEREAFDLFGVVFDGHNDLRRILTDYGFIGHPFRKDFPTTGHVEMRYDVELKRVIYQPVSIELREITPRIIRENNYGGAQ
jgi:NADH-quinone oxidoreductase subunit C